MATSVGASTYAPSRVSLVSTCKLEGILTDGQSCDLHATWSDANQAACQGPAIQVNASTSDARDWLSVVKSESDRFIGLFDCLPLIALSIDTIPIVPL